MKKMNNFFFFKTKSLFVDTILRLRDFRVSATTQTQLVWLVARYNRLNERNEPREGSAAGTDKE